MAFDKNNKKNRWGWKRKVKASLYGIGGVASIPVLLGLANVVDNWMRSNDGQQRGYEEFVPRTPNTLRDPRQITPNSTGQFEVTLANGDVIIRCESGEPAIVYRTQNGQRTDNIRFQIKLAEREVAAGSLSYIGGIRTLDYGTRFRITLPPRPAMIQTPLDGIPSANIRINVNKTTIINETSNATKAAINAMYDCLGTPRAARPAAAPGAATRPAGQAPTR